MVSSFLLMDKAELIKKTGQSEMLRFLGVEIEVAMRIAARGEDEHRAPPGGIQVVFGDRDPVEHEPDQRDEELGPARLVAGCLERL